MEECWIAPGSKTAGSLIVVHFDGCQVAPSAATIGHTGSTSAQPSEAKDLIIADLIMANMPRFHRVPDYSL